MSCTASAVMAHSTELQLHLINNTKGEHMTNKLFTIFILFACLAITGCSKRDDEVNRVIKDLDTFTTEMLGKLSTAKDPATGVNEAQNYFNAQKADLQKKFDTIKEVRGYQISETTKKQMEESLTKNLTSVASLQVTYINQTMTDKRFAAGLEKLINDYQQIFKS